MAIYHEAAEEYGANPGKIGERLTEVRGGFWDVMMIGSAFSYSITCSEYVELASSEWNVLLCRESEDADATRCGAAGLTRYTNGTLDTSRGVRIADRGQADGAAPVALGGSFHLDRYMNYMTDDVDAKRKERVPVVSDLLESMLASNLLHAPSAADELRRRLWPEEGISWNVLVEVSAGGHYYYSEEQFNFDLRSTDDNGFEYEPLSVAIFDRRCDTLERESEQRGGPLRGADGALLAESKQQTTQLLEASVREFGE